MAGQILGGDTGGTGSGMLGFGNTNPFSAFMSSAAPGQMANGFSQLIPQLAHAFQGQLGNPITTDQMSQPPGYAPDPAASATNQAPDGGNIQTATPDLSGLPAANLSRQPGTIDPQYIYNGLKARGFNDAQAFAAMGNWKQESEFNPKAYNPGEGAIGLDQWRLGRATNLKNYAASVGQSPFSPDVQMDFFKKELPTLPGGKEFLASNDINSANKALHTYIAYGSPYAKGGEGTRLANAYGYAKLLGGPGREFAPGETLHVPSARRGGGSGRQNPDTQYSGGANVTIPGAGANGGGGGVAPPDPNDNTGTYANQVIAANQQRQARMRSIAAATAVPPPADTSGTRPPMEAPYQAMGGQTPPTAANHKRPLPALDTMKALAQIGHGYRDQGYNNYG